MWGACVVALPRNTGVLALLAQSSLSPALAHHAFSAEFDIDKPITLVGTITGVEWQNPHTWFYLDVPGDGDSVAKWGMELASPNLLMRNGWKIGRAHV